MGGHEDRGGVVLHLCIPSVLLPCPGRTPGCPHIPIYVPRAHIPTSPYPHIPISPCPLSHVSDPPRGTFVPSLKGTEKESGSAVTKPTEPRQCGVGTAPPVSPLPPACVPVSPRPPPPRDANASIPENEPSAPFGRTEGGCGAGEGCVGGSLCVCECTRACTALPPAAGRGQQSCRQRSWVGCEGVHARAGTVCTRRAVRAQRRASPPPCTATHVPHTHTHTHHPCTPLCGPAARRGGVAGGAERRGTQPRGVQTAGCEPAGPKPPCR